MRGFGLGRTPEESTDSVADKESVTTLKIWTDFSSILSQFTLLADGQTDGILIARTHLHSMQFGKNQSKNY